MKQTAVEWLADKMLTEHHSKIEWDKIVEQAKAMEKKQIIEARNNGFMASGEGWNGEYGIEDINLLTKKIKSEQYYDETFKSE